ncbi:uncharacterized protein LOC107477254 [Arachis duranensis]|uniref:Uncharacterized protein LOC107477254 n=1 Tax=Arachis duranensis TaxID=130453 RepID=A0A9C6TU30_ARADU|nr:uncharacterized protein LOC107477254 [Arachis duranensis]
MCYATTLSILFTAFLLRIHWIASVSIPSSNCYAFDNSSHIVDFSSWIGYLFEYDVQQDTDLAVRFCKDVESRSQTEFYNGDLMGCEQSYDKMGRTAQVNIICGSCPNGQCKGRPGCICSVTYESKCRVSVELALPCEKPGPQVFQGFTVGFHPRSWEIVYNGMTQFGFEKSNRDFSFHAKQSQVVLFMTAIASHSSLVQKPSLKVRPEKGLEVKFSGSANHGKPPTTLSPTMLIVDWRCEVARDTPYEVNITIPIKGYEPIEFVLTKFCDYTQEESEDSRKGWAIFGVLSCIFFVSSTLFCCGGFIYKTKVERQRGIDALPGMTILSACLETISGAGQRYMRAEEQNSAFGGEPSWGPPPSSSQDAWKPIERRYGAI